MFAKQSSRDIQLVAFGTLTPSPQVSAHPPTAADYTDTSPTAMGEVVVVTAVAHPARPSRRWIGVLTDLLTSVVSSGFSLHGNPFASNAERDVFATAIIAVYG